MIALMAKALPQSVIYGQCGTKKMDAENLSGDARTKRDLDLVLCFMRFGIACCRDSIYKAVMITSKEERFRKHKSFQKAVKFVIHQNGLKIHKKNLT